MKGVSEGVKEGGSEGSELKEGGSESRWTRVREGEKAERTGPDGNAAPGNGAMENNHGKTGPGKHWARLGHEKRMARLGHGNRARFKDWAIGNKEPCVLPSTQDCPMDQCGMETRSLLCFHSSVHPGRSRALTSSFQGGSGAYDQGRRGRGGGRREGAREGSVRHETTQAEEMGTLNKP